jgi:hypothetical protein
MALVLVDGENVRRSLWPNLARDELERLAAAWGEREGHDVRVESEALAAAGTPFWVATSDRGLRARIRGAERLVGGGSFARGLRP